jgi:hypothetical protein
MNDLENMQDPLRPVRGCVNALAVVTPFWIVVGAYILRLVAEWWLR